MVRRASTEKFDRIEHLRERITLHPGDLLDHRSLVDTLRASDPAEINLAAMSFVAVGEVFSAGGAAALYRAAAVISTHRDHLETRYAFRTRLLDCLWAGVPARVIVPLRAFIDRDAGLAARSRATAVLRTPAMRPLRRAAQRLTRLARRAGSR